MIIYFRVAKYGQLAPECVDAYVLYGKALLENAVVKNTVLGQGAIKSAAAKQEEASAGKWLFDC